MIKGNGDCKELELTYDGMKITVQYKICHYIGEPSLHLLKHGEIEGFGKTFTEATMDFKAKLKRYQN